MKNIKKMILLGAYLLLFLSPQDTQAWRGGRGYGGGYGRGYGRGYRGGWGRSVAPFVGGVVVGSALSGGRSRYYDDDYYDYDY